MWALLSARLRTWLLMAIALPLARLLVQHAPRWPVAPRGATGQPGVGAAG